MLIEKGRPPRDAPTISDSNLAVVIRYKPCFQRLFCAPFEASFTADALMFEVIARGVPVYLPTMVSRVAGLYRHECTSAGRSNFVVSNQLAFYNGHLVG